MKKALLLLSFVLVWTPLAQAAPITYGAVLTGPAESPPNSSAGTGVATVTFDPVSNILTVDVTFAGLTGATTASHIHCCTTTPFTGTAIVATQVPTFIGFPLGVTAGTYLNSFNMTLAPSYNPAFITAHGGTVAGAEADFAAGLNAGTTYLNIHTNIFPGGEIRGFLTPVPEPGSLSLLGLAAGGWLAARRRRPGR